MGEVSMDHGCVEAGWKTQRKQNCIFRGKPDVVTLMKAFELSHLMPVNHAKSASWQFSQLQSYNFSSVNEKAEETKNKALGGLVLS